MKQKIHPAFVGIALACVIGVVIFYAFRTATEKPAYPGLNAPQAAAPRGGQAAIPVNRGGGIVGTPTNAEEARKMGIPGAVPLQHR